MSATPMEEKDFESDLSLLTMIRSDTQQEEAGDQFVEANNGKVWYWFQRMANVLVFIIYLE
jgi:hypothetical protein